MKYLDVLLQKNTLERIWAQCIDLVHKAQLMKNQILLKKKTIFCRPQLLVNINQYKALVLLSSYGSDTLIPAYPCQNQRYDMPVY